MKKIIIIFSVLLFVISCNDNEKNIAATMKMAEYDATTSRKSFGDVKVQSLQNDNNDDVLIDRKLIKNGNISFEVHDLDATRNRIETLLSTYNGYISSDNEYASEDRISNTLNIRVPSENFDTLLTEISKGVKKFDNKSISIRDVTEQFLDIEARLKNKKELENKYLEILKKANNVREILDVERELSKLREDIEATEGRLQYLQNQISFSTLHVTFYKTQQTSGIGFSEKLSNAFKNGLENINSFFLFFINYWPFFLAFILVFFYFRRKRNNRKKSS